MAVSSINTGVSSALSYSLSRLTASAQATIDAASKDSESTTTGTISPSSGVSISRAARIAAAEQADNAKDFTVLSQQVRQALDAQYASAEDGWADLTEMSGRALAAIALNKTSAFNPREMAAAKKELNERARVELAAALKSGNAMDALVSYNQQLVADYDGMTQEERDARGWTDKTRSTAEAFITTVNGTENTPSLFDLLNDES
jgi:hypothetical protein